MSKYNRTNFYTQVTVNGILENDLVSIHWDLLQIKRPLQYVTLTSQFIQRPDLLSYYIYRQVDLWWIISWFNQIDDWWNDLTVGNTISAIDIQDIDDWYISNLAAQQG